MISMSIVRPMLDGARLPSGVMKRFSGDTEGQVTRRPLRVGHQVIEAELGRLFHHGPGAIARGICRSRPKS